MCPILCSFNTGIYIAKTQEPENLPKCQWLKLPLHECFAFRSVSCAVAADFATFMCEHTGNDKK